MTEACLITLPKKPCQMNAVIQEDFWKLPIARMPPKSANLLNPQIQVNNVQEFLKGEKTLFLSPHQFRPPVT